MRSGSESIAELLVRNIPRDLVLAVEDAFQAGAQRAYAASRDSDAGHRRNVLGQLRHFYMNELFHSALEVAGASPSQLRGNEVVAGAVGAVRLGRFNVPQGIWNTASRASSRRIMALANKAVEALVQADFFVPRIVNINCTAFFAAVFDHVQPELPISIQIAVPDSQMKGWLFRESTTDFLARYEQASSQADKAIPKLKVIKKAEDDPGQK